MAATVVNAAPNRKAGARAASPADFVPKFEESQRARGDGLDPRRIRAEFISAFGGRIKRAPAPADPKTGKD